MNCVDFCFIGELMNIVITMAGKGSRFRKVGYDIPKYMIEVNGKTLFTWSMLSLQDFIDKSCKFIFVVMKDEKVDTSSFIDKECKSLGITNYHVITIDYLTDGQATSVMLANRYWQKNEPILIYNIDTYVEPYCMRSELLEGDGCIPCFIAAGDHWSFVKLNEANKVVEIKEKERISDYCTIGAYYFSSASLYARLYDLFYRDNCNTVNGEKYIAPMYNYLIAENGNVTIQLIDSNKVHVLGTPEEVNLFKGSN